MVAYYYTFDHLGSTREVCNSSGTIVARYGYDAYGNTTLISGSNLATKQYARYYHHPTSGLYLTKYRAYDPSTARWLSRDPIGENGGLDLYEYANDNPANVLDSAGLAPDRPIDKSRPDSSYNCGGLAFRNYQDMSLAEVKAKLSKCKKVPCNQKCNCGQLKCWFWQYNLTVNTPGQSTTRSDFHVVCGKVPGNDPNQPGDDPSNSCSKNGHGPVVGPGPGPSFKPSPDGGDNDNNEEWITRTHFTTECYCCPGN